jgi:hypothetical protein
LNILLRAAIAAAGFASIGSANASEGDETHANTLFTQIPGVIAQPPEQHIAPLAVGQIGQGVHVFVTQSGRGIWLFAPNQTGGGTNG